MSLQANQLIEEFKPRELEVLRLIADGRTNQEIASHLMIEVTTVRWHSRQIYSKFGVHSRTLAVARARELGLLAEEESQVSKGNGFTSAPLTNLPAQATSFVGRVREIAKVRQLLMASRLLTLTGPGGTGKTRLALQVAEALREEYADGIWFVPLAAVQDPAHVALALAGVLKVAESQGETIENTLIKHLHDKQMLLVVDNFEHVVEAAPLLAAILAGATQVKLLVTSREVLRLYGEQEYPVPSLTVPEGEQGYDLDAVAEFESVRLFVERAQASQPAFGLTTLNAEAVAQICMRLDGLPLALELAAARIKLLAPQQLLARLEHGLSNLGHGPRDAPARQRTLRATIDWSYNLLSADEKRLFSRLGVFRGGWTLEAMEAVCCYDLPFDTLEGLNSLIDKSLVLAAEGQDGIPRFRMLKTVRDVAWEQLEPYEARQTQNRHRDWFLQVVERAGKEMQTADSQVWYALVRLEEDNLNAALDWCLEGPESTEIGLRLASLMCEYWFARGTFRRGRAWLDTFLARSDKVQSSIRARALASAGMLAKLELDYETVARLCSEALEIAQALGDRDIEAFTLHMLAHVTQEQGNFAGAKELYSRSITLFQEDGNLWGRADATNCLGDLQRQFGHYEDAVNTLSQALVLRRYFNNRRGVCTTLSNLGFVHCRQGNAQAAAVCFREALEISQALGRPDLSYLCLTGFAAVAMVRNDAERAARLLGVVDGFHSASYIKFEPAEQVDYDWIVAHTRVHLSEERFAELWAQGRLLSLAQAVAYAVR